MKVLYVHQYFKTPSEAGGTRSYYFARKLVERGHDVVVLTSENRRRGLIERREVDGIQVVYIRNAYSNEMALGRRIWSFLRFMALASACALRERRIDLVFATSTPLSVAIPGLAARYLRAIPFVFEVRDVWPQVPYEMGFIRSRLLFRAIRAFEGFVYRKARRVVTVSEGISDVLRRDHGVESVAIPFGSDLVLFDSRKDDGWRRQNGIHSRALFVYTGALGFANSPDYLLEAARVIKERGAHAELTIAVVGAGKEQPRLCRMAEEEGLGHVRFLDPVPFQKLGEIYRAADAGVILFGGGSQTYRYTASPNKFFDYIAAGLPVLFNFDGPLKRIILEAGAGLYSHHERPEGLAENILSIVRDPEKARRMGLAARRLAEERFSRNVQAERFAATIEAVGGEGRAQNRPRHEG